MQSEYIFSKAEKVLKVTFIYMWRSNLSQILSHHTGRKLKNMIPYTNTSFTYVFNNISGKKKIITFLGMPCLALQWLGLCFYCRGPGSIPGGGAKIPKAMWHSQNRKTNKISLLRSDLPMLLQERKSILVSFSFSPQTITLRAIKFMSHMKEQSWSLPQRSSGGESPPAIWAL